MNLEDHGTIPVCLDPSGTLTSNTLNGELKTLNMLVYIEEYCKFVKHDSDTLYIVEVKDADSCGQTLLELSNKFNVNLYGNRLLYIGDEETLNMLCLQGAVVVHTYIVSELQANVDELIRLLRLGRFTDNTIRYELYKSVYHKFNFEYAFKQASGVANDESYSLKA